MNDVTPWYDIDVRAEVLDGLRDHFVRTGREPEDVDRLKFVSVRDLMDGGVLAEHGSGRDDAEVVRRLYFAARTRKYGSETFLHEAEREREIAYSGQWHSYLHSILEGVAETGGKVLFVGTADGSEIPSDGAYRYYAIEQLHASAERLGAEKIEKLVVGDFEDEELVVDGPRSMSVVVALRCLMPNTRLDRFMGFVRTNLRSGGAVIMSHPMGCLMKDGCLHRFDDADSRRRAFECRLHSTFENSGFVLTGTQESSIEVFYLLRAGD